MTVEKPKPKQLLRPITTGADSAMNQSQFLAITCNSLEAREKSRVHGAIGFGFAFASHWLKNWRDSFKPISKRSNRNHFRHSFENRYSYYNQPIGNQDVSMGTRARSPATLRWNLVYRWFSCLSEMPTVTVRLTSFLFAERAMEEGPCWRWEILSMTWFVKENENAVMKLLHFSIVVVMLRLPFTTVGSLVLVENRRIAC